MRFSKYEKRGAYHWDQIGKHPIKSNAFVRARYEICINLLKASTPPPSKVLDLGCGDGALTYLLYKAGYRSEGVDTSKLGIYLAKEQHQIRKTDCLFQCKHSAELPDESYDAIVCSDVIEHVEDFQGLIMDIYRLLKPMGVAVISTPIRISKIPTDKEHLTEWFSEDYKQLFDSFSDVRFSQSHPIALMELMNWGYMRAAINLFSLIHNPFFWGKPFRYFALQYAILKKQ